MPKSVDTPKARRTKPTPAPAKAPRPLPASSPELFDKSQLRQLLGCSSKFIESEVSAGRLRALRLSPKMIRFTMSDVTAWLASKAV
jgi:predicted DNA-binding transcriptional regulator AlpA